MYCVGVVEFKTSDVLRGESNSRIEFKRSYQCNANQVVNFTTAHKINPFWYVSQLRVQAFHFSNSSKYDNGKQLFILPCIIECVLWICLARVCVLDNSGKANKIVPIAVGAALAGLVVVVLVAYLIGRLRSRRQSSYEALS